MDDDNWEITLKKYENFRSLIVLAAVVAAGCGGGSSGGGGGNVASAFPSPAPFPATTADVPTIAPSVAASAAKITADPAIKAIAAEWATPADIKDRINKHFEFVRIASPSRYEMRRQAEYHRVMTQDYGFDASEVKTSASGVLPGSDVQIVDGLPVYNACVEIKGTYSSMLGAESYKGQYPKVLVEAHIDVVNPATLPPATAPYLPIKLAPITGLVPDTPAALAALPDSLSFTSAGKVIEDAQYAAASKTYATVADATAAGAVRIYVPGLGDAGMNDIGTMRIAKAMKAYKIKPVYDIWICGTAGEEGKGNLAGMKQLYGYDQTSGKGTNPLNFVMNLGIDGGAGDVNFTGSYRFEFKYKAPTSPDADAPSAVEAVARAIANIAKLKTASDIDKSSQQTTYTVGMVYCDTPPTGSLVTPSCSLQVDMRSLDVANLNNIRSKIEPNFVGAATEENASRKVANNTPQALSTELVWFGDRPAHKNSNTSDVAIQSAWASAQIVGVDKLTKLDFEPGSLNDNVPAALNVPTTNLSASSMVSSGGGHAFYEYGVFGNPNTMALRMQRILTAALIAAGFNASDGTVVLPTAQTIGARTADTK